MVCCWNMLHVLLLLSSLSVVTESLMKRFDIHFCPINYYGIEIKEIEVFTESTMFMVTMNHSSNRDILVTFKGSRNTQRFTVESIHKLPDFVMAELKLHYIDKQPVKCAFTVTAVDADETKDTYYFVNIGSYSFVYLYGGKNVALPRPLVAQAQGRVVAELARHRGGPVRHLFDMTACRKNGHVDVIQTRTLSKKCQMLKSCDPYVVEDMCGPFSRCDNGSCARPGIPCTIIASTMLDSMDGQLSFKDRCSYTLLSIAEFHLLGKFDYRRHTAFPFLDSLHLTVGSTTFHLLQGGRVNMDETSLTLNRSVQVFNNTNLSKDESEVKVKVNFSNGTVFIFFDGTAAYISAESHAESEGLCVTISGSAQKKYRRMDLSEPSCRRKFTNEQAITECPGVEERCDSTFTNDTTRIFTKICSDLLCQYGDFDNLFCHMQTIYTHKTGHRPHNQSCVLPPPCLNHYCASHEFCGMKKTGEAKCFCREHFIEPYRKKGKYGDKTTCEVDTASVELPICLLEDKGFDVLELHLLDEDCRGQVNTEDNMVTFSFTHSQDCGAKVLINETHIMYINSILALSPEDDVITRDELIYMNFSCCYEQPDSSAMAIRIIDGSLIQEFLMGLYKYTLVQKACTDHGCKNEVKAGKSLRLGQTMWIHLDVENLDPRVALLIDSCWATVHPSGKDDLRHNLVTDGCSAPEDHTVRMIENGDGDHCSFSFKIFKFIKHPGVVHMHCRVGLCLKDEDNLCLPDCEVKQPIKGRSRRSVTTMWTETVTAMSWINPMDTVPMKDN